MSQEDSRKIQAKQALLAGETIASIAARLGVNRRTIERWADDGAWREQKQAQNVVSIGEAKSKQPKPVNTPTPCYEPRVRQKREQGEIDELEIVEGAIISLDLLLAGMGGMSGDGMVDTRGIGGTAGALVKLLEYRRKIKPPTAAELAEQAIAFGMSPAEFARELRQAWEKRA
jgi:transposase-like protein